MKYVYSEVGKKKQQIQVKFKIYCSVLKVSLPQCVGPPFNVGSQYVTMKGTLTWLVV